MCTLTVLALGICHVFRLGFIFLQEKDKHLTPTFFFFKSWTFLIVIGIIINESR